MTSDKTFYFVNKHSYINHFKSNDIKEIFHEILQEIDNTLSTLIKLGVSVDLKKTSFDHLSCIETINSENKSRPLVTNIYKIDMENMTFLDHNQHIKYYISDFPNLNLVYHSILQKKNQTPKTAKESIKQSNQVKKIHNIKEKKKESINDLINETSTILNGISSNSKLNGDNKIVNPDIVRPMNSVLYDQEDTNNNNVVDDNKSMDLDSDIDPDELKKVIDSLKQTKEMEMKKIEELKKKNDEEIDNFSQLCNNLGDIKRNKRRLYEREQEKKNRFNANKYAYFKIKQDIVDGRLTEDKISELFVNEYPIYKFMDENKIMDKEDEYIIFNKLYDEMYNKDKSSTAKTDTYVPHNINYLSPEEQEKYKDVIDKNKDIIDEFIEKKSENKKSHNYPSLEQVLNDLDSDDELGDVENVTFDVEKNDPENGTPEECVETNKKINRIETIIKNELSTD